MNFTVKEWDKVDGEYIHRVVTYDGKNTKVYLNGKLVNKQTLMLRVRALISYMIKKAKDIVIFDEHKIDEHEQWTVAKQNDSDKKSYTKFMQKQMKKPRARYLKKLRAGNEK